MTNISHIELSKFGLLSPVECHKLNILSVMYSIVFVLGIILNLIILWAVFYGDKTTKRSLHWLIISHTLLNLVATVVEMPFTIIGHIKCKWLMDQWGCSLSSFMTYFSGCSSIYIMVFISIERYYNATNRTFSHFNTSLAVIFSLFFGFYWAVMPMFGWSYYSLEVSLVTCSIEWYEQSFNVVSYNVTIFLLVFLIPVTVILITSLKVYNIVKKVSFSTVENELYLATTMFVYILLFLVSWSPYALVSFAISFFDFKISPTMSTLPTLFAKTSVIWCSLFYICTNDSIKKKIKTKMGYAEEANLSPDLGHSKTTYRPETKDTKQSSML